MRNFNQVKGIGNSFIVAGVAFLVGATAPEPIGLVLAGVPVLLMGIGVRIGLSVVESPDA